ncbi:hypothetical protein QBC36DRAFT_249878 [Triangularia setosa]|uniref:Uncharacterized protein n=1 Tax=Triangularia setosa TaxID=2587417 RepID=A0AAN6VWX4_9PEZI|nr:hypothetical protein QBC36DRAFT_249878 [Podospora setosa]
MPNIPLNTHGQPLTAPKPPSWTHHPSSQPQLNAYITRIVLSNGYVAYRAELAVWFPDYKYLYRAPCPQPPLARWRDEDEHWRHNNQSRVKWNLRPAFLLHKLLTVSEGFPLNRNDCWPRNCAAKKGHLFDVKIPNLALSQIRREQEEQKREVEETVWWLKFDCRAVPEEMRAVIQQEDEEKEKVEREREEKERLEGGRMVQRGEVKVWRKEPRFRGSGRVVVLDDPVRNGLEVAFSGEVLPSDFWKVNGRWRAQSKEEEECEDELSLADILRDEPAYTVRTVARRGEKRVTKNTVKKTVSFKTPLVEEIPYLQPPELLHPDSASDYELSIGSDSGCEYDSFLDFSEDEAQGWVPVMVREDHEEEEEGWVSLSGSWMMLGGVQENKRMVKM